MLAAPRPLASLSSGLLARKGEARPAMRRQATLAEAGDELGWNDMGEGPDVRLPPVLAQREELEAAVAAEPEPEPVASGRRVAFTLRLDGDRHMRLRLAAAARRVSSQRLVTQALDAFLSPADDTDTLTRATGATTERSGI